jgi:alkylation response protein AidB-like acyl-CoA dehydrogenase
MSDEKGRWLSLAQAVARDVLAPHAEEIDRQGSWPGAGISALGESGLLGLTVPASYGGAGQGPRTFAGVTRALAEECASTAMIYLMHVCATQTIVAADGFSRREDVLRSATKGRHINTVAFSEKGSRSHFWAPVSQAQADGNTQKLTADKSFVTSAGHADGYVVSTRSAGVADPLVSTLYYVPRETRGLSVSGAWNGIGLRGNASAPMRLEKVDLPPTHRLGSEGGGFALMMSAVLPWFQLGTAAVAVGIAAAATRGTREHLLSATLEHLGQPLASLPTLRARLAQMQIAVDTQQAFLEQVAGRMEHPGPETLLAILESKAAAAEAALQVTDLAMRTCGGAAYGRHLTVERNFRDARAGAVMAPTTDVLHDFVAKTILDMPLF